MGARSSWLRGQKISLAELRRRFWPKTGFGIWRPRPAGAQISGAACSPVGRFWVGQRICDFREIYPNARRAGFRDFGDNSQKGDYDCAAARFRRRLRPFCRAPRPKTGSGIRRARWAGRGQALGPASGPGISKCRLKFLVGCPEAGGCLKRAPNSGGRWGRGPGGDLPTGRPIFVPTLRAAPGSRRKITRARPWGGFRPANTGRRARPRTASEISEPARRPVAHCRARPVRFPKPAPKVAGRFAS